MSYWPYQGPIFAPGDIVWSWDPCGPIGAFGSASGAPASATWGAANRAFFYPVKLSYPFNVKGFACLNGTTAAGNIDLGVYDRAGTRIVSTGSTVQSGNNVIQTITVSNKLLLPGLYYLAAAADSSSTPMFGRSGGATPWTVDMLKAAGCCTQDTAFTLPAAATFATMASDRMFAIAMYQRATV